MSPKVVVVTGSSRGLGLEITRTLVASDYFVVGLSRTTSESFDDLVESGSAVHVPYDAEQTEATYELTRRILADHGPVYGLVNNAATGGNGVLATQHASDIERIMTVNVLAPILLTKYLSRSMLKAREGRVVNITSIAAKTGYSGLSVYSASKSALEGFTRSLSREVGKRGVTVNAVAPGFMATEMTTGLSDDNLESILRRAPLGATATSDVAPTVLHLLSEAASQITGTVVTIDGGSSA